MKFAVHNLMVALLCLLAVACRQPPPQPLEGEVLRLAVGDPVASLDPAHATPPTARMLSGAIYDTLYRYQYLARPYRLTPGLAVDFPTVSADGLVYTIRIREGVLFHGHPQLSGNDREVTAQDVVYSLLRQFDPDVEGQGAWLWNRHIRGVNAWRNAGADHAQPPAGLRVVDRYTLEITLNNPFADFMHTLALPVAGIVSRTAIEHFGEDYPLNPIGSGPYQWHQFSTTSVVLKANPDYQRGVISLDDLGYQTAAHRDFGLAQLAGQSIPMLDAIEIRFVRDSGERWLALQAARVDGMLLPAVLYDQALESRRPAALKSSLAASLHLNRQPLAQLYKIDFNMNDIRLGDQGSQDQRDYNRRLRCDLREAFDWEGYNREFFSNLGYVYSGVVPPLAGAPPNARNAPGDDALFAGLEHLPAIEFGYSESDLNQRIFEYFQDTLSAAGYPREQLRGKPYEGFSAFATAYTDRLLPLVHTGWALDYPSGLNTLQLYVSSNASPGPGVANYDNPDYDQLYVQAYAGQSSAQRKNLVDQMQQILDQECVTMAGFSPAQLHVWRRAFVLYPDSEFAAGEWLRYAMPAPAPRTASSSGKL